MTPDETIDPALGGAGEPCAGCGFPLAADQRYCLNCGRRRGAARLDYAEQLAAPAQAETQVMPAAPEPAPAGGGRSGKEGSPLVAVGGVAILGLMLLVGVLIGRGGGDGSEQAPAVVRVPATGGAPIETASTDTGGTEDTASKADANADKGNSNSGGNQSAAEQPEVADIDDLEALDQATGEDYAEQAEQLPDTIQIPGEPPPKDNVEPGAGTDAVVIE